MIERAMTYICTCPDVWEQFYQFVENVKEDREYLKASLFSYRKMLVSISSMSLFLLCDICELNGEIDKAREIYNDLGKAKGESGF